MKRASVLLMAAVILLSTSCAHMFTKGGGDYRAGNKAYEQGSYDQAVEKLLSALSANPEFEDARSLLDQAFTEGDKRYRSDISAAESSDDDFAYDSIWKTYRALQNMHQAMAGSPYASEYSIEDFSDALAQSKEKAASAHYQAASELLNAGGYKNARQALGHIAETREIIENYKEIADLYSQAQKMAIAKVMVYQYVSDENFNIAAKTNRALKKGGAIAQYNDIDWTSGSISSLDAAIDEYQGKVDLLLYINGETFFEVPEVSQEEVFYDKIQKTVNKHTFSYRQGLKGEAKLVELSDGSVIDSFPITANEGDSFNYYSYLFEKQDSINFENLGSRDWRYVSYTQGNEDPMKLFVRYLSMFNRSNDDLGSVRSFSELKRMFNKGIYSAKTDIVVLLDVQGEILTGMLPFEGSKEENEEAAYRADQAFAWLTNTAGTILKREGGDFGDLEEQSAAAVADTLGEYLK